ncbi:MAG: hypothetical protein GY871_04420 [Actinomycetales bacterium]|nr:hypothetical protein [Actinomycetales bacterium]
MRDLTKLCPAPSVFGEQNYLPTHRRFPEAAEARVDGWMNVAQKALAEHLRKDAQLDKKSRSRQRLIAGMCENMVAHIDHVARRDPSMLLSGSTEGLRRLGVTEMHRKLVEQTTTADIATWTTQQLAWVTDVFADFIAPELFTTIAMTGPTAFVNRQTLTRADASDNYAAGSALTDGLDPSYSECPTACERANGIDVEITQELVEAVCRRLSGKYCIPANYHASSQYGVNIAEVLMQGMGTEIRRAMQSEMLTTLVANAGGTDTWNETPPAGYFSTANPNEWRRELWRTAKIANRAVLNAAEGRVSVNILLGDVDAIGHLEDPNPIQFQDGQPSEVNFGQGDEVTEFMGVTKANRWRVYRFLEGMAASTILVMNRNDADPTAIYAPWIPFTSLGVLQDPETADVKLGGITLYGLDVTRGARIREIAIGA